MIFMLTATIQAFTASDANYSGDEATLRECSLTYYSICDSYTGAGVNCHAEG